MVTRIILADDHPIFRDGVARTLDEADDFEVVGTGESAQDAIDLVKRLNPDIALLDLSMPGSGINAARAIAALDAPPVIAILTVSEEADDVADALEAGAKGYILKGVSGDELCARLRGLARGDSYIPPVLATRVLSVMRQQMDKPSKRPIDDLTKREEDILRGVAKGLSNKEIALELDLQEKTIKHYMTAILSKLHARNRVEAALIASDAWGMHKP
ncbi:response regulator [Actibacterium pelagium]|nr:response regulator transcription factor [Actibacterium pelagium]